MITWRSAVVSSVDRSWPGCVETTVDLETPLPGGGTSCRALAFTELVGRPTPGDRVLLNVSALARGLGTGGFALVVALPDRLPADPPGGPGHLVKARYTPLQAMVLGVDEQESAYHDILREADDLAGLPVVTADLHSAVPAIIWGLRSGIEASGGDPAAVRVAYVMTDGAALPAWFSQMNAALRELGWITGTITAGQSFGGDLEAATVHTALLSARLVLDADIVVLAQGPGNLGTGTAWGFSGVSVGEAVNAAATLRGRPIGSLRISGADARGRHLGISHHSLTAYGRVALAGADIVVPEMTATDLGGGAVEALLSRIDSQTTDFFEANPRHRQVGVPTTGMLDGLATAPIRLSTMGRGLREDPAGFLAAAAAGRHAATLLVGS